MKAYKIRHKKSGNWICGYLGNYRLRNKIFEKSEIFHTTQDAEYFLKDRLMYFEDNKAGVPITRDDFEIVEFELKEVKE